MERIDFADHPMLAHFRYLREHSGKTPKMTIPSPSMLHYRGGRKMINMGVYPTMEEFYHDLGQAYKQAVHGFYDAGCRYLQIDDCSFAYLCDPAQREMLAARGDDPVKQGEIYVGMMNAALENKPADLAATMHVCRGNFRSTFVASGGYEHIADLMFNKIGLDGYFLERNIEECICSFCSQSTSKLHEITSVCISLEDGVDSDRNRAGGCRGDNRVRNG
jgi:5-methyltetrahydropteroyltriglutamate--homocysteine methyltransferase